MLAGPDMPITDTMPTAPDMPGTDATPTDPDMPGTDATDDTDGMPKAPEIPGTDSMLGVLPKLGSVSLCAAPDGPGKQSTIEAPDIPGTNAMPTTSSIRPGADLMHAATDQPNSGCMPILCYIDLDSTLAVPAKPDTERTFVAIDNFDTDGMPAPL
ncbi:hypothetical protein PHYSODRAFT_257980 [Phytophthora sojae]|uniref:Uncharacterized protein n=1 Tax=Phytophthora sojae (strain P6497) TaxID=1094619 RepID=G4YRJ5_PHYSP|nr:hypothetical protein PHYSODRAFT_257980 [Phytophthora sojae]EGZ23460.1 hypothetical protein PHYSODRAFT_257980 [Phytophthora sojae]|eukprot:XP_009518748.1 hypothetical protein PHYSODRAFT_257980 [Phytophthora sojae]